MSDTTIECASCGQTFDGLDDTHYRISEEERPVKDRDDMEFDDWFSQSWLVCSWCASKILNVDQNP